MADRQEFRGRVDFKGDTNSTGDFTAKHVIGLAPDNQEFGVYEAAYEIDFGGSTITTTDNGLIKTVATIPANVRVIEAYMLTTEAFDSDDEKGVDLVVASTSPSAADDAITATAQVITACELKSSAKGALNSFTSAAFDGAGAANTTIVDSGAGTHLCLINTDGSNASDTSVTGKVLVYIKYMGSESL